jgi:hypothetical protein
MKVNQAKVEIITDATAAGLEAAVNAWLEARKEETLVSIQFTETTGNFTAYIVYTK